MGSLIIAVGLAGDLAAGDEDLALLADERHADRAAMHHFHAVGIDDTSRRGPP